MSPTRAGVALFFVTIGLAVAARVLGLLELYVLAAMLVPILLFALAYPFLARLDIGVSRVATPARLRAGTTARIDLVLHNRSRRPTPVMAAHDQLQDGRGATVHIAPLPGDGEARLAYRLPARQRGRFSVGPLDLTLSDPLGLSRTVVRAARKTDLMIHPKLIELDSLVAISGHDPTAVHLPRRAIANSGDEFFALRPYVIGDELKRVNWRASAHLDELVVRQVERPKTGRVTIILDRDSEVYDQAGFERAVSATLSTLHAGFRGGDSLRFLTSASPTGTDIRSRSELDAVDEQLALIKVAPNASVVGTIQDASRAARGGTLVVVTGAVGPSLEKALAHARRKFGLVIPISCQRPRTHPPDWILIHDSDELLAERWREFVSKTPKRSQG